MGDLTNMGSQLCRRKKGNDSDYVTSASNDNQHGFRELKILFPYQKELNQLLYIIS